MDAVPRRLIHQFILSDQIIALTSTFSDKSLQLLSFVEVYYSSFTFQDVVEARALLQILSLILLHLECQFYFLRGSIFELRLIHKQLFKNLIGVSFILGEPYKNISIVLTKQIYRDVIIAVRFTLHTAYVATSKLAVSSAQWI